MKKLFLTYVIAPMLLVAGILLFNGASAKKQPVKQKVIYNTLASNCFETKAEADAAFGSAMTDQKRCHFVDEQESQVWQENPGLPAAYRQWCFKVVGW